MNGGFCMKDHLERASFSWTPDSVRWINTPGATAKALYFYVQEAGYFRTFPPYFTERENLDSYLLLNTVSGCGHLRYGGRSFALLPGQCFFISCMEHHRYAVPKGMTWEFSWLHFNAWNAAGIYREYVRNGFHISAPHDGAAFEKNMEEVLRVIRRKTAASEALASGLIGTLLASLLAENETVSGSSASFPAPVRAAMEYIDGHFREDLTLEGIAGHVSFSRFYLSREFHRCTGMTLMEYLIRDRLAWAKEELRYTEEPVSAIALSCGMHSASRFISLFRQREGVTPQRWRASWKEQ